MELGYLAIVLHGHLPFVRHPEHPEFLEEDWLFEAITETYIPLINVLNGLAADGVDYRLTLSLSPTLVAMLKDPLLQERYLRHISRLVDLADREAERTSGEPGLNALSRMYQAMFRNARLVFDVKCGRDLTTAFRAFQDQGRVELITCAATHGYLPLMLTRNAVRAQVLTAVRQHERHFGRMPKGIWLPECAYAPGIDEVLNEAGIRYFFTESHSVLHASPRPAAGTAAPIVCGSGVAAFGRDPESSRQVWSSTEGYPGDHDYRDFYRDIGFDHDYASIRPYLHPDGLRVNVGIKYHRITGPGDHKELYDRSRALDRAATHAGHFLYSRGLQIERLAGMMQGGKPVIVAPYDAELFGHWWFEGPDWLNCLIRKTVHDQRAVRLVTPSEYLDRHPDPPKAEPAASSWGAGGFNEVWLDGTNDWIYRHLHAAEERMIGLVRHFPGAQGTVRRALCQAARELMLAQGSDWAFMMRTGSHVEYAVRRTREHLLNFMRLSDELMAGRVDEAWLGEREGRNNLFPDIDPYVYA